MFRKLIFFFKQSWLLLISAFVFGLLLAVTYAAWSPIIEKNQEKKLNNLMAGLISDANNFEIAVEGFEMISAKGKAVTTDIYRAIDIDGNTAGFAFIATGAGFADKIKLVIAGDSNFEKLLGYNVLASNETPGFGDRIKKVFYRNQFVGAPADILELIKAGDADAIDEEIVSITGATISSEAVIKIFNRYITEIKKELSEKGLISDGR